VSAGVAITATLPGGTVGVAYNAKLTATGGTPPYTWSIVSGTLPPGLSLAADGTVSGTPTAAGTYQLTVQVDGSATKAMTVVIAAAPATPTPPQAAPATPPQAAPATPPQAAQAAAPSSSSQIPFTGADTTSTVGGAIALLLLGAGLVVATRRRPHGKHYAR
ncbi:MAG TPA: putative Ig domain-containing protein, partial [Acidimicrobiales bacterium]|nr:putative Ig domain-containing protein [Acidimicrobiales bacterium]